MSRVEKLKQDIFKEIWAGAGAQNFAISAAKTDDDGEPWGCAYRGLNNCRCNVGFLIPDDRYTAEIEGSTVMQHDGPWKLTTAHDRCKELGLDEDETWEVRRFLADLQNAHDSVSGPEDHKKNLVHFGQLVGVEVAA